MEPITLILLLNKSIMKLSFLLLRLVDIYFRFVLVNKKNKRIELILLDDRSILYQINQSINLIEL